jgi:nucleoside-diphosphate-sugar epimerase
MRQHPERVIITGAAGWLGRSLYDALTNGLPEHGQLLPNEKQLDIRLLLLPGQADTPFAKELPGNNVCIIRGDIQDADSCQRLFADFAESVVIHTVAVIHPARVRQFYDINVRGTANLLEAAAKMQARRFIHLSSNSVCGTNLHPDHLFDECSAYRPYMHYGRSKMLAELEVKKRQSDLETVILRAPWFYGPHQPARQSMFFKMVRDGRVPIVGSGNNLRSMVYLDNLCSAIILAAQKTPLADNLYWVSDARPYSMNEIVNTIERLLLEEFGQECSGRRWRLPSVASDVAFALDWGLQNLGLYDQKIHVLSEMNKTIACSPHKAMQELGYNPAISLEEGMRRSIRWCLEQKLLP